MERCESAGIPYTFDFGIFDQRTNAEWYFITDLTDQGHFPSLCLLTGYLLLISPVLDPSSQLDAVSDYEDEHLEWSGEKREARDGEKTDKTAT